MVLLITGSCYLIAFTTPRLNASIRTIQLPSHHHLDWPPGPRCNFRLRRVRKTPHAKYPPVAFLLSEILHLDKSHDVSTAGGVLPNAFAGGGTSSSAQPPFCRDCRRINALHLVAPADLVNACHADHGGLPRRGNARVSPAHGFQLP